MPGYLERLVMKIKEAGYGSYDQLIISEFLPGKIKNRKRKEMRQRKKETEKCKRKETK